MPGKGAMDDDAAGYDENLAAANNAEFGDSAIPDILPGLAEGVASSAAGPEDALNMCRDLANAEDLDDESYLSLVAQVEARTGWELPAEGERF